MGFRRAQGSSEYIILMSVVLVIALIAIALLAMVPDAAFGIRSSMSDSYWRGQARPMSITDHSLFSNGTLALMFINTESSTVHLYRVDAGGIGNKIFSASPALIIGGGSSGWIVMDTHDSSCRVGDVYEVSINLTYSDTIVGVFTQPQFGEVPLVGRCGQGS